MPCAAWRSGRSLETQETIGVHSWSKVVECCFCFHLASCWVKAFSINQEPQEFDLRHIEWTLFFVYFETSTWSQWSTSWRHLANSVADPPATRMSSKYRMMSGMPFSNPSISPWKILGAALTPYWNHFTLKVPQCVTIVCTSMVVLSTRNYWNAWASSIFAKILPSSREPRKLLTTGIG